MSVTKLTVLNKEFTQFLHEINCSELKISTGVMWGSTKPEEDFCYPSFKCTISESFKNEPYEVDFKTDTSMDGDGFGVEFNEHMAYHKTEINIADIPLEQVERAFFNAMKLAIILWNDFPYCGIFSYRFDSKLASVRGEIITRCVEKLQKDPQISASLDDYPVISFERKVELNGELRFYLNSN